LILVILKKGLKATIGGERLNVLAMVVHLVLKDGNKLPKGGSLILMNRYFQPLCWDRWILRNLYSSGSDAGFFWDFTDDKKEGFTVILEDCVSIGRAFGGDCVTLLFARMNQAFFEEAIFLLWIGTGILVPYWLGARRM